MTQSDIISSRYNREDCLKAAIQLFYAGGNYEEVINHETGKTKSYHYIHGGSGLAAVFIAEEDSAETDNLYYVHKDYLGSILALTNQEGTAVERYSFDAWGHRRNPTNWSQWQEDSTDYIVNRGFTGHEHMDIFGLINMNGRVYDPDLGRFISPDPYVQMPDNSQNFNRYSYCLNNPLIYTDPSGEFIFTGLAVLTGQLWALPITIGADFGAVTGGLRGMQDPDVGFWKGAGRGALVGGVGGGLSMIGGAGMSFAGNLAFGTAQGALTGGLDAAVWGNDIGEGMLWGAAGGAVFTTLTSENFSNALKGEGFYTNENVFNNMMERGMDKQAMLDYFSFEGTYAPGKNPSYYKSGKYYGATLESGNIVFGELAFENYATLKGTYIKESFHARKILKGIPYEKVSKEYQGLGFDLFPEEIQGYIHAYKNQGLFLDHNLPLQGIEYYQTQLDAFDIPYRTYPKKWNWIYKIPRRW